jgi:bacteriocin propeptide, TIGR03798 family
MEGMKMTREEAAKFIEKINDEAFIDGLLETKDVETAQKYIQDAGIEITADEVKVFAQILHGLASGEIDGEELKKEIDIFNKQDNGEELSEDELEIVAGGCLGSIIALTSAIVVTGVVVVGEIGLCIYDQCAGTNYSKEVPAKVINGIAAGYNKVKEFENWILGS